MDPVGPQKGKFPNTKDVSKEKLGEENTWESNAPKDLGGGFNKKSGTRPAGGTHMEDVWQGTVKGKIVHTYGKDGKNDPEHNGKYKTEKNIKTKGWDATSLT